MKFSKVFNPNAVPVQKTNSPSNGLGKKIKSEDRIIDLERGGVDRGEWICKIETTFKTYSAVGRSRAVAEENVIKKCNKDTLSSNCRNATCSN